MHSQDQYVTTMLEVENQQNSQETVRQPAQSQMANENVANQTAVPA